MANLRAMRIAAVVIAICLAACGKPAPVVKKPYRMPVLAAAVAVSPLAQEVRLGGSLDPAELVQITSRVSGVAEQVRFNEGDRVEAGQVLVEIEPQRYRVAVERALAGLAKAEAQVAEARASLARREELAARNADLVQAEELAAWRSRLAQAEADAALARAGAAQAELDAHDAMIRAPIGGAIETRSVRLGQHLAVGTVVATQVRRLPLRLRVRATVEEAALLRLGMAVSVQAGEASLVGHLVQVGSAAEAATRTVPVVAEIPEPPASVVAGGFAELRVSAGGDERLAVPAAALRATERGWIAYVIEGSGETAVARRRVVGVGLRSADGRVEIRSGLAAGEQLIVRGADALRDGQPVAIQTR